MNRLALAVATSSLIIGGCTTIQQPSVIQTASPVETEIVKKKAAGELDLVEVQDQLSRFVEIIELLAQAKKSENAIEDGSGIPIDINAAINKQNAPTPPADDTQQLIDIVNSINNNLEKLDKAQSEAQSIRQILAIADQYTGNKQDLFSGLFDILTRDTKSDQ